MKKLFALLLTVVMMASMMAPAMAEDATVGGYEAITPADFEFSHSLRLTNDTQLDYDITYSFKSTETAEILSKTNDGVINDGDAVTGYPTIADVKYSQEDEFSADNLTVKKILTVDMSGVKITQPGIYRWTITQSVEELAPDDPSNTGTFYVFAYVIDNNGKLQATVLMSKAEEVTNDNKTDRIKETYPAETVDLTITKLVEGNQGSKEQYFKFVVDLTAPNSEAVTNTPFSYVLSEPNDSYDVDVPKTAYNNATQNPTEVVVTKGVAQVEIWLKHGQSVTIKDMIYGTKYSITESNNTGYTVSATATGHTDGFSYADNTATDDDLIESATVTYKNTKSTEVPTGISLQSGVAFFGLVLAMGMMVLLFVGKRKEQN